MIARRLDFDDLDPGLTKCTRTLLLTRHNHQCVHKLETLQQRPDVHRSDIREHEGTESGMGRFAAGHFLLKRKDQKPLNSFRRQFYNASPSMEIIFEFT